ncbi:VOC family protein [Ferrimonas balearica]|uniref:VOC family protein n=1 Tax=Ferrimonas balearica TaxID=44012 RepID=UPI001C997BC1|nr:VOC family protein [Ferrimonas balearica]MBY5993691.1 VOC family protein [Ferrimonas balearica]
MSHYKPSDVPTLMPYLMVKDVSQALDFYQTAFGFERAGEPMVEEGVVQHAEMVFDDCRIMMGREGAFGSEAKSPASSNLDQGMGLYLYCPDVDAHFEQAQEAGARIMQPVQDMFWGDRIYTALDLDGYRWSFATHQGQDRES